MTREDNAARPVIEFYSASSEYDEFSNFARYGMGGHAAAAA